MSNDPDYYNRSWFFGSNKNPNKKNDHVFFPTEKKRNLLQNLSLSTLNYRTIFVNAPFGTAFTGSMVQIVYIYIYILSIPASSKQGAV